MSTRGRILWLALYPLSAVAAPVAAQMPPLSELAWLPGDVATDAVHGNEQAPALCPGGAGFLLVWNDMRTMPLGTSTYQQSDVDLVGQLLDIAGGPMGPAFPIADSFGYQRNARVAWNGENWLVAWNDQAPTQFFFQDAVKAVRVSPLGEVLDAPFTLFDAGNEVHVTANGSTWLAVSQSYDSQTNAGLVGRRIAADGTLLDDSPVVLVPGTYFLYFSVDVVAAHGEYLLTWSETNAQKARRFDADIKPLAAAFGLPGSHLAGNGDDWFLAWNDGSGLRASPLGADGTPLLPAGAVVASGFDAYMFELDAGWDGGNWIVAWVHTYDAVRLARVTPAGAVLDPGGVVMSASDAGSVYGIDVAGAAPGWGTQIAWSDIRGGGSWFYDLRGRHASKTLVPGPWSDLSLAPPAQMRVELAEYPGGSLAVFESRASLTTRILSQRLAADGTALDADPLELAAGSVSSPSAVWDGERFLVVWSDVDGIRGVRLGPDGVPLDASFLVMADGFSPDVAALDGVFLVVGLKFGFNIQYINVHAARIDGATGQLVDPVPISIAGSYSLLPRVISIDTSWLITWEQHGTHDDPQSLIAASFLLSDGSSPGTFNVTFNGGHPDVAWSGSEALFVFRVNSLANANNDVWYRRMTSAGGFPAPQALLSDAAGRQLYPAVAWDGAQFLAAWEDQRNQVTFYDGRTDVYAARISAAGVLLDPVSFALETGAAPQARPALAAVAGTPGAAASATSIVHGDVGGVAWRLGTRHIGIEPLWSDLGQALAGAAGAPFLQGDGALIAGTHAEVALSGAAPLTPATLVIGLSALEDPFKGGVLVPSTDLLVGPLVTDAQGAVLLVSDWPAGVPSGTVYLFQTWIEDSSGPKGLTASNALGATVP